MLALHHRAPVLQGRQVMIAMDNAMVVSYINRQGGTHSHSLVCLVEELFVWLWSQDIVSIPDCPNGMADRLSGPDLSMSCYKIFEMWGFLTVDMFATVFNTQHPQCMSLIPEPQALAMDALSQL